jgi:hypothetical protein
VRPRLAVAVLAAAGVLAMAGCGGGGGPPRLSEAAYTQRAEAICSSYRTRLHALGEPDQLDKIAPYLAKALPILAQTVDRLGTLRPPKRHDQAYGRFLAAMRTARKRAFALRDAAARADGAAVQQLLDQAARAGTDTEVLARRAGLPGCTQS